LASSAPVAALGAAALVAAVVASRTATAPPRVGRRVSVTVAVEVAMIVAAGEGRAASLLLKRGRCLEVGGRKDSGRGVC